MSRRHIGLWKEHQLGKNCAVQVCATIICHPVGIHVSFCAVIGRHWVAHSCAVYGAIAL